MPLTNADDTGRHLLSAESHSVAVVKDDEAHEAGEPEGTYTCNDEEDSVSELELDHHAVPSPMMITSVTTANVATNAAVLDTAPHPPEAMSSTRWADDLTIISNSDDDGTATVLPLPKKKLLVDGNETDSPQTSCSHVQEQEQDVVVPLPRRLHVNTEPTDCDCKQQIPTTSTADRETVNDAVRDTETVNDAIAHTKTVDDAVVHSLTVDDAITDTETVNDAIAHTETVDDAVTERETEKDASSELTNSFAQRLSTRRLTDDDASCPSDTPVIRAQVQGFVDGFDPVMMGALVSKDVERSVDEAPPAAAAGDDDDDKEYDESTAVNDSSFYLGSSADDVTQRRTDINSSSSSSINDADVTSPCDVTSSTHVADTVNEELQSFTVNSEIHLGDPAKHVSTTIDDTATKHDVWTSTDERPITIPLPRRHTDNVTQRKHNSQPEVERVRVRVNSEQEAESRVEARRRGDAQSHDDVSSEDVGKEEHLVAVTTDMNHEELARLALVDRQTSTTERSVVDVSTQPPREEDGTAVTTTTTESCELKRLEDDNNNNERLLQDNDEIQFVERLICTSSSAAAAAAALSTTTTSGNTSSSSQVPLNIDITATTPVDSNDDKQRQLDRSADSTRPHDAAKSVVIIERRQTTVDKTPENATTRRQSVTKTSDRESRRRAHQVDCVDELSQVRANLRSSYVQRTSTSRHFPGNKHTTRPSS